MSWKDRATYQSKTFVEREVNGSLLRFYPNRYALLQEMSAIAGPLAKAIITLSSDTRHDATAVTERFKEKDTEVEKITVQGVSTEVLSYRAKEKAQAIDELVTGLTNARTRLLLGKLLMDSMREEFDWKRERTTAEVEEFLDGDGKGYAGLDVPTMVELVKGWMAANSKAFGLMGEQVVDLVSARLQGLRAASDLAKRELSQEKTEVQDSTNGSSSKTASSTPLATVSD